MSEFSDAWENIVLNAIIGNTAVNTVDQIWVGLASAAISDADTNATISAVELVTTTGIVRVVTSTSDWNAASGGSIDNANAITFASSIASFNITHFFLSTGSAPAAGGTAFIIGYSSVDTAKSIASSDIPQFAAGDLTMSLA